MPYDPFKPHRHSIRLRGYDYSAAGVYFVTICTQNRECLFGEIVNAEMHPNRFGEIILKWWDELPRYYPPTQLDEFVVMPNHIHGIIVIGGDVGADARAGELRPFPKRTLGQLVGYFKFESTTEINQIRGSGHDKLLQRGYYEHIIRNEHEWNAIAQYIRANPANWHDDMDNPVNRAKRPTPDTSDEYWHDAGR